MKYMQISIVKEQKTKGLNRGNIKDHGFYNLKWFKNPAFIRTDSLKEKKKYIRAALSKVDLSQKSFGPIFDEKETVIVNVEGRHGVDNAIFDEEMRLPDNLIDDNKNRGSGGKTRVRKW